jgi:hypothetical protein
MHPHGRLTRSASVILAMFGIAVGGYLAVSSFPRPPTDMEVAHEDAARIGTAIQLLGRDYGSCSAALIHLPELRPAWTLRADPWGTPWSIRCHGDLAVVRSAGPDAEMGTAADVVEVAVAPSQGR